MCIWVLIIHYYQVLFVKLYMYLHRAAGREEDNRWLSGTYLLVHPAAKHLGNARVRLKVLLELNPQSSGRASSRQWQVPHVAPTVIRAAGYSPRRPAEHGPALRPREGTRHDPLRASAQTPSCGKGERFDFDSTQQHPAEAVAARHSMAMAECTEQLLMCTGKGHDTSSSLIREDNCSQQLMFEDLTVSGLSTRSHQPINPTQASLAALRSGQGVLPMPSPQGSPAGPERDEEGCPLQPPHGSLVGPRSGVAAPTPAIQNAAAAAWDDPPHPQAVSSTAHSPPSHGRCEISPEQGQGSAAGHFVNEADDRSASAQVEAHVI